MGKNNLKNDYLDESEESTNEIYFHENDYLEEEEKSLEKEEDLQSLYTRTAFSFQEISKKYSGK